MAGGEGGDASPERMAATDPAFILATSGTTATPKLAVHVHGGYMVGIDTLARWTYGLGPDDVWWSTSDIGWIVGHSYIVYGPLLRGATTIAYEGALDHPGPDVFFRMLEEHHVSAVFTAPTAVRMLMTPRHGRGPPRRPLLACTRVFCAGEPLNPPAWEWLQREAFAGPRAGHRPHVADGDRRAAVRQPVGPRHPADPAGLGRRARCRAGTSTSCRRTASRWQRGEQGVMIVRRPFPSLTPTIWNDPERYARDYWGRIEGVYSSGDAARLDDDGYVWFGGRADEIINIAGHRIGTVEVESALLRHPAVAEAGVTGRPDELRGEVIAAFVVLRPGHEPGEELDRALRATVRAELGAHFVIGELLVVDIAAQDPQRQDHAARAAGRGVGPRPRRHLDDRGRGIGRGRARGTRPPARRGGATDAVGGCFPAATPRRTQPGPSGKQLGYASGLLARQAIQYAGARPVTSPDATVHGHVAAVRSPTVYGRVMKPVERRAGRRRPASGRRSRSFRAIARSFAERPGSAGCQPAEVGSASLAGPHGLDVDGREVRGVVAGVHVLLAGDDVREPARLQGERVVKAP